ncbi:MAG: hypothetical protein MZV70_20390 [Desulfobacterales bacterium]|nr:hypothetical protein [Desulfobacterales bacterium]
MATDTVKSQAEPDYVVIDSGKTSLKDLYKKEDWMAVWMGFLLLIVGLLIYLPRPPEKAAEIPKYNAIMKEEAAKAPFKTIEWYNASSAKRGIRATNQDFAKTIQSFLSAPSDWDTNPLDALYRSEETAKAMGAPFKEAADKAKAAADAALAKRQDRPGRRRRRRLQGRHPQRRGRQGDQGLAGGQGQGLQGRQPRSTSNPTTASPT